MFQSHQTAVQLVRPSLAACLRITLLAFEPYEILTVVAGIVCIMAFRIAGRPIAWEQLTNVVLVSGMFTGSCILIAGIVLGLRRLRKQLMPSLDICNVGTTVRFYLRIYATFIVAYTIFHNFVVLTAFVHFPDQDALLRRIDQWIFGVDPTIALQSIITPVLSEYMRLVYTLYLFLFFATPTLLAFQNRRRALSDLVFSLVLTMYIGFIGYILVPAVGPYAYPPLRDTYTVALDGSALAQAQADFVVGYSYVRSVFPSLHTAISAVVLVYVFRYHRELRWPMTILVVSIWCSTIYLRYHYVIDLVAGWLLTWLVCWISPVINRHWQNWRHDITTGMKSATTDEAAM